MNRTTILIVEDEAIVAENLKLKLEQLGYAVAGITGEGETAVEMVRRLSPRLILMDINLKGSLNGIETTKRIQTHQDIPVIYLTAYSDAETLSRAKITGPFGYILKPFQMRDLETQIELALYKHQAERQLREQREWLQVTLASIGDAVITTDTRGMVTFLNPAAASLIGWPAEEAAGKPLHTVFPVFHEETGKPAADPVEIVLRTGESTALPDRTFLKARNGRVIPIEDSGAPIRDGSGRIHGVVLTFRDITDRLNAQREQEASEARLRLFIEHAPAALAMFDRQMRYLHVSRRWVREHNMAPRDLIGRSHYAAFPRVTEQWRAIHQRGLQGEVVRCDLDRVERSDGSVQWIRWEVRPWYDTAGGIGGILIFNEDLTRLKRSEEERDKLHDQLLQARKLESIGRLAGGVAHDFNNMLSIIIGHGEMAMEEVAPDSAIYADLNEIQRAAQRSADLTRQLLAFARKQVISPKVLDLNDTISNMLKMLRRLIGEDIRLAWRPARRLRPVRIDPAQADQMLANLCVNARDAISGVGTITIETRNVEIDDAACGADPECTPGEYVLLTVGDDGCGVDQETAANLFEPFFTTKEVGQGTGLGLATVYGIVKQNNGFITVESEPGEGTLFRIYLPGVAAEGETPEAPPPAPVAGGNETILLVEDEQAIMHLAKSMLERRGYTVLAARSPGHALDIAAEDDPAIDLLLTDVVMPEMDGHQLAERIRALRPRVKVLFMSGYSKEDVADRGVMEGNGRLLRKPFENRNLLNAVRQVLDTD